MKITPTSLTLNQLLGSANEQFVVPAYQRRYSWRERQVYELIEDIELLEETDVHLLGSIVCLTGHHTPGLNRLELVDGQQRLTTLCIVLECLRQRLAAEGELDQAQELVRLLSAKALGGRPMPKIALDSLDGDEYRSLVSEAALESHQNLHLERAFVIVRKWLGDQSLDFLGTFLYRLQNQAYVVRLDVTDAKDAFKLFETINNRGLRLSPTDIIKNFVLGNAARFDAAKLEVARKSWALLIRHLDGTDTDAFFRYFLMSVAKRRITKSQVVPEFQEFFMSQVIEAKDLPDRHLYIYEEEHDDDDIENILNTDDVEHRERVLPRVPFRKFLSHVVDSARIYGQLVLAKSGDKKIDRRLRNLRMIKSAQTYGLLMHMRLGGTDDKSFIEALKLTESFVLRRHVCRERSNDTETLFAKLCEVDATKPLPAIKKAYREACPSDEKFKREFARTSFTSNITDRARYCLEQIELRRHGKYDEIQILESDDVHIEHIIPQKIKSKKSKGEFGDWLSYLGEKADILHPETVSRIGNLTLFAGSLNIGASNNPFSNKKQAYEESSIIITRDLCKLPFFKFKQVDTRSNQLADVAVELWPIP